MKIDSYGLLVTDLGDGGDTARAEGSMAIAGEAASAALKLFSNNWTVLVRNPQPGIFWSDPTQTSRDQTLHAFTYLSMIGANKLLHAFLWAHVKRWLTCQNGDVMWGSMCVPIRALNKWWLYPLLMLHDCFLIFGVMERCHWLPRWDQDTSSIIWPWTGYDPDDVGDDLNLQMSLVQPGYETPVRVLCRWLYKKYRPIPYGMGQAVNKAHACWVWYYRAEADNILSLPNMWRPLCIKYF